MMKKFISKKLKMIRLNLDLSQDQLRSKINVKKSRYSKMESSGSITLADFLMIVTMLKISNKELIRIFDEAREVCEKIKRERAHELMTEELNKEISSTHASLTSEEFSKLFNNVKDN